MNFAASRFWMLAKYLFAHYQRHQMAEKSSKQSLVRDEVSENQSAKAAVANISRRVFPGRSAAVLADPPPIMTIKLG
jgi:hypothetical protein